MTLADRVLEIRQEFENRSISDSILADLYAKYSDIEDTGLFVRKAKEMFPRGNCGLASLYLKKILGMGKLIQGKYGSEPHTYLSIGEDIIDITADQYGGPKVYIGPLIAPWTL